ncbi:hypothetical protein B0T21DRAFT_391564 [Apiosordaria backusii]|uniref:F-box domain-containing protein n=1 Tax=Apiosordaria backusii TaxID=314023 RepID=A0AA40BS59_9PEZI|nr:hypothetical protein B0T21DRAFT_391564 [Apiosordaria backusii]
MHLLPTYPPQHAPTVPALSLVKLFIRHESKDNFAQPPTLNTTQSDFHRLWQRFNLNLNAMYHISKGLRGLHLHQSHPRIHQSGRDMQFMFTSYGYCIVWAYSPSTQSTRGVVIFRNEHDRHYKNWFSMLELQPAFVRHPLCLFVVLVKEAMEYAFKETGTTLAKIEDHIKQMDSLGAAVNSLTESGLWTDGDGEESGGYVEETWHFIKLRLGEWQFRLQYLKERGKNQLNVVDMTRLRASLLRNRRKRTVSQRRSSLTSRCYSCQNVHGGAPHSAMGLCPRRAIQFLGLLGFHYPSHSAGGEFQVFWIARDNLPTLDHTKMPGLKRGQQKHETALPGEREGNQIMPAVNQTRKEALKRKFDDSISAKEADIQPMKSSALVAGHATNHPDSADPPTPRRPLDTFPTEILWHIFNCLVIGFNQKKEISLVCRRFRAVLIPILFRTLALGTDKEGKGHEWMVYLEKEGQHLTRNTTQAVLHNWDITDYCPLLINWTKYWAERNDSGRGADSPIPSLGCQRKRSEISAAARKMNRPFDLINPSQAFRVLSSMPNLVKLTLDGFEDGAVDANVPVLASPKEKKAWPALETLNGLEMFRFGYFAEIVIEAREVHKCMGGWSPSDIEKCHQYFPNITRLSVFGNIDILFPLNLYDSDEVDDDDFDDVTLAKPYTIQDFIDKFKAFEKLERLIMTDEVMMDWHDFQKWMVERYGSWRLGRIYENGATNTRANDHERLQSAQAMFSGCGEQLTRVSFVCKSDRAEFKRGPDDKPVMVRKFHNDFFSFMTRDMSIAADINPVRVLK